MKARPFGALCTFRSGLLLLVLLPLLRSDPVHGFLPASIPPSIFVSFSTTTTGSTQLHYGQLSSSAPSWNPAHYLFGSPGSTTWTLPNSAVDSNDDALEAAAQQQYDANLFWAACVPPLVAFGAYGPIAHALAVGVDVLGFRGANVDGNAFATNLLRPTLNGVVGTYGSSIVCSFFMDHLFLRLFCIDLLDSPFPITFPTPTIDNSPRHGRRIGYAVCDHGERVVESTAPAAGHHQQGSLRIAIAAPGSPGMFWHRPAQSTTGQCAGIGALVRAGPPTGNPNPRLHCPIGIYTDQRWDQQERIGWCVLLLH